MTTKISFIISIISVIVSTVSFIYSRRLVGNRSRMTKMIFQKYCERIKDQFVSFGSDELSLKIEIELRFHLDELTKCKSDKDIIKSNLYSENVTAIENFYYHQLFDCCKNGSKQDINIFEKYLTIKEYYQNTILLAIKNQTNSSKETQEKLRENEIKLKELLISDNFLDERKV